MQRLELSNIDPATTFNSPVFQIICLHIFRPTKFPEDDLSVAFYDLLFVYVVLAEQAQRIGHASCLIGRLNLPNFTIL